MIIMVFAQSVIALGVVMQSPLVKEISLEFGVSVADVGQFATVITGAAALSSLLVVPMIDRIDRRSAYLTSGVLLLLSGIIALVAWNFWILAASRLLIGVSFAFGVPTLFAATADLIPYETRARANGWLAAGMGVSFLIGAPIVSTIAGLYGWRAAFLFFIATTLLMVFGGMLWFPSIPGKAKGVGTGWVRAIGGTFGPILRIRSVRGALIAALMAGAPFFIWQTYMGAFFQETYGISVGDLGPVMVISGLGFVLGGVIGGPIGDRIGKKPMVLLTLLALGLGIILEIQIVRWLPFGLAIAFVLAGSEGPRIASLNVIMAELVPNRRGAVLAVYTSTVQVGMFVIGAVAGLVVGAGGYTALGWLLSGVAFVTLLLVALLVVERVPQDAPLAETAAGGKPA